MNNENNQFSLVALDANVPNILGEDYDKWQTARAEAIANMLMGRTPEYAVKHRKGRGGLIFAYSPHAWVVQQLNLIFMLNWSWDILREEIGAKQVWVRGNLVVTINGQSQARAGYGGSEINRYTSGERAGEVIDIRDDLQKASSIALRKAASLFGISADLYAARDKMLENTFDLDAREAIDPDSF